MENRRLNMPSQQHCCSWSSCWSLESVVRLGLYPDSPNYLSGYLQVGFEVAAELSAARQGAIYYHLVHTLLDTIRDTAVARHWRCLCLDYAYQPLIRLCACASTAAERREVKRLQHQLSAMAQYLC